ncbi:maleylpyruvate isomerase [Nocardioides szechwanensis]|uniref:Maleylpyruvate isomerase n=1 Tax=Nocardioides szechwanensis TaxID=1005944 RepID=A0A1G9WS83_9ACTN|nr:maleylpyruvate isomerase family mycothiol-dependent enzyme [Nocardioides szechwanensis]GEP32549.1 maleylpyruvate isomerase [Nocardioides szechwanensis]SDM87035.1 maleylpyruvate isomerase [Nocardioides szechwanensis]
MSTITDELQEATGRLVRTVDGLSDEQYAGASGLPGWSRAHVVAHLALNAEGLTGALGGVVSGEPTAMYASQEHRDGDIEALAGAATGTLRERLLRSTTLLADALAAVPEEAWSTRIERTPGGPTFTAYAVPGMRLREVEIHHADLGLDYTRSDWPESFCTRLLAGMVKRDSWAAPFTAAPTDLDGTWQCGDVTEQSPVVRGRAADLGWWLTGRGDGDGLTSDNGDLPRIEEW